MLCHIFRRIKIFEPLEKCGTANYCVAYKIYRPKLLALQAFSARDSPLLKAMKFPNDPSCS